MAKIKRKHLLRLGYDNNAAIKLALQIGQHEAYAKKGREVKMQMFQAVLHTPEKYLKHELLRPLAVLMDHSLSNTGTPNATHQLLKTGVPLTIYGQEGIEQGALDQIYTAAKLPVSRLAALMPDAHQGYGLPIGGVLATEGAIIPYAVGVDIGCRMCMTVYDIDPSFIDGHRDKLKNHLITHTFFGAGRGPGDPMDDEVLERSEFREIKVVKGLHDKAAAQIGSSGGGNHFVEFGVAEILSKQNPWKVSPGKYLSVLSHSGSRGLGASIANHYTKLAVETTPLPKVARHLAWLDMESEAGQEYWRAMNLAGDYASACHHHIHYRLGKALGEKPMFMVENHHNFAWKEQLEDGTEVYVHRKGATPAGKGVLGIIPGSMTAPGFIVRGRGVAASIQSASHGAGRILSRRKAKEQITRHALKEVLKQHRVQLIGGGLDEAPMAYKDIRQVMDRQKGLVDILGTFRPRIVRMDE